MKLNKKDFYGIFGVIMPHQTNEREQQMAKTTTTVAAGAVETGQKRPVFSQPTQKGSPNMLTFFCYLHIAHTHTLSQPQLNSHKKHIKILIAFIGARMETKENRGVGRAGKNYKNWELPLGSAVVKQQAVVSVSSLSLTHSLSLFWFLLFFACD